MLTNNEVAQNDAVQSDITEDLQALFENSKAVQILDNNTLSFSSDIDTTSANELIEAVYEMDKVLGCEGIPIRLLFSTNGGDVNEAMRLINVLKYGLKRPVYMYANGYVYSAGVSVLAALKHRFTFPYTFFMVHSVRLSINESLSWQSLKASQDALFRLEQRMTQMLFDSGVFTPEEFADKTLKGDYLFSVDEAMSRGLVTKVVTSDDFDQKVGCLTSAKQNNMDSIDEQREVADNR